MTSHWVTFSVTAGLLLLNLVLAFVWWRKGSVSSYVAEPDRYSSFTIALTISGTIIGGGMFLAVGQIGYEAGIAGYVIGIVYLVGLALTAAFARSMRGLMVKHNALTLVDVLVSVYRGPVAILFILVNMLMYVFLLAGQFVGMFVFARYVASQTGILWMPWVLVGLATMCVLAYSVVGGLRKDIQTDVFQVVVVLAVGIFVTSRIWLDISSSATWRGLPSSHLDGSGYGLLFIVGAVLFLTPSFLVRMDIWQRVRAAATDSSAAAGLLLAGVTSLFAYFFFTSLGVLARAKGAADPDTSSLWLLDSLALGQIISALVIAALFFAVLSSADTFVNNSAIFVSTVVKRSRWGSTLDPLQVLRGSALVVSIAAIGLATIIPNFVELLVGAFSLLLIFLPTIVALFIPPWQDSIAAAASISISLILFLILFFFWSTTMAFVPAVLMSGAVFGGVRFFRSVRAHPP